MGGQKVTFLSKLLSDEEFQESIGGTVDAAVNLTGTVARVAIPVAQGVLESVPTLVTQGSRFAGSVVRAANDTSPLLLRNCGIHRSASPDSRFCLGVCRSKRRAKSNCGRNFLS